MLPNLLLSAVLIGVSLMTSAVAATADDEPNSSRSATYGGVKPLKVFILAGQSNMQGHAHVSTFSSMADDPKTAAILEEMRHANGQPRVCENVWISSVGCAGDGWSEVIEQTGKLTAGFGASTEKIGPEFTFGIYMEKLLGEPILIIKTSWGGRSLHTDFRPPGAGPYVWSAYELTQCKRRGDDLEKIKADKLKDTGLFYRHMIEHVRKVLADIKRVMPAYDEKQGYELAGFVWFQGFNDLVSDWTYDEQMKPGGYDRYGELLAQFIRDVRHDLSAPKMPFVIGVMGIDGVRNGEKPPQMYFRQAQAAPALLPEFKGNVVAVQTSPFWDDDLASLQERMEKLNDKLDQDAKKSPKLTPAEKEAARKKAIRENFTPDELKRLKGVSNGGYHYLGAAKILAPIGKAFAEALAGFQKTAGLPRSFNRTMRLEGSGTTSAAVSLGDINGDRHLDIVLSTGRHWPGPLRMYLNDGTGKFPVASNIGDRLYRSYGVPLADLNRDGSLDLVVGTDRGDLKPYFFNDGKAGFKLAGNLGDPEMATRNIALADINSDGKIDIVAVSRGQGNFIYLNDGTGHFPTRKAVGSDKYHTVTVDVGDLNGDGKPDLALANRDGQQCMIYLNDGQDCPGDPIPFGPENADTRAIAIGEIDGDGNLDIVASHLNWGSFIYIGDGKGSFPRKMAFRPTKENSYALAVADLNRDGQPDIVAGNVDQANAVYFNKGQAKGFQEVRFGEEKGATYGLAIGDLDGDGFPDIVIARTGGPSAIFFSDKKN